MKTQKVPVVKLLHLGKSQFLVCLFFLLRYLQVVMIWMDPFPVPAFFSQQPFFLHFVIELQLGRWHWPTLTTLVKWAQFYHVVNKIHQRLSFFILEKVKEQSKLKHKYFHKSAFKLLCNYVWCIKSKRVCGLESLLYRVLLSQVIVSHISFLRGHYEYAVVVSKKVECWDTFRDALSQEVPWRCGYERHFPHDEAHITKFF